MQREKETYIFFSQRYDTKLAGASKSCEVFANLMQTINWKTKGDHRKIVDNFFLKVAFGKEHNPKTIHHNDSDGLTFLPAWKDCHKSSS